MNNDNKLALSFAIIGNTLNLAYNIPFVYLVWKNRSSKNISGSFLLLRFLGSISWIIYAIIIMDSWVGASYLVTLTATSIIGYIKLIERMSKKENQKKIEIEKETELKNIKGSDNNTELENI